VSLITVRGPSNHDMRLLNNKMAHTASDLELITEVNTAYNGYCCTFHQSPAKPRSITLT